MCKVITVVNQKGGVGKTTTTINLGIGLVQRGHKVLLVDVDSQGSLSAALGIKAPDELKEGTIGNIIMANLKDVDLPDDYGIVHHEEGVDFVPSNTLMASVELEMQAAYAREYILKAYIEQIRDKYDYIFIDCPGSLGVITINALSCADSVLIPAQSQYLTGLAIQQLFSSVAKVRKRLNRKLRIEGLLFTMTTRTNFNKDFISLIKSYYGSDIRIFDTTIPTSVRATEATAKGVSIFKYMPDCSISKAYQALLDEMLGTVLDGSVEDTN